MKIVLTVIASAATLSFSSISSAEDKTTEGIAAGAAIAKARCASCHGEAGISNTELWPNLAGQKAAYLGRL